MGNLIHGGLAMGNVVGFVREHFSIYAVILILISSCMLIFSDRHQLKSAGLKKEASFSLIVGILYAVIAAAAMAMGIFLPK